MLPDCRESLAARQEGTNSVQGVPAALARSLTSRAKAQLCAPVCVCMCVFLPLYVCVTLSATRACLCAGAFVGKAHVSKRTVHTQTSEARFCPVDFSDKIEKEQLGKTNAFVCVRLRGCVCVCERHKASLPAALPCNLPLLHPG